LIRDVYMSEGSIPEALEAVRLMYARPPFHRTQTEIQIRPSSC